MSTRDFMVDAASTGAETPIDILKSVFTVLNQGNIFGAVDHFAEEFTYNDYALDLEFTDRELLIEFFRKSRELFPDTALEIESTFAYGDHAVAEWKLTATQTEFIWNQNLRFPVVVRGSTIVRVDNGRVTQWSEYYDERTSRRYRLAGMFKEWKEY